MLGEDGHMEKRWHARVPRAGLSALLLAAACSGGMSDEMGDLAADQQAEDAIFPGAQWAQGDAAELGFDASKLEQVASEADPETMCMMVTRHGQVVGEWYYGDATVESVDVVMSVTQAYVSTLVGIAQDEGLLDIDDKVSQYIPEWVGTDSEEVTIRQILAHTSGRESTNSIGNAELHDRLIRSEDPGQMAIGLEQVHEPGTVWSQNLPAIELLNPILTAATGQDPADYAQEKLLGPIGATHTKFNKTNTGVTWMHSFLETTCEDAARFGYLILRKGNWNGTQIVSEEWVEEATSPSQEFNPGWGFLWWLNRPGSLVSIDNVLTPDYDEPSDLKLVPDAPDSMFWGLGFQGRLVQIDNATDTVVVRLGTGDEAQNMQEVVRLVTETMTDE
jgi:CubicO group peptidase (beta-lactamase class C family)